jgi:hypothetical protein
MIHQTECKVQCKHTWHALGFRNLNPRHDVTSPLLGESTSPQWVNGLILPCPYLLYLRGSCMLMSAKQCMFKQFNLH